jgi:hypothetical protein
VNGRERKKGGYEGQKTGKWNDMKRNMVKRRRRKLHA